MNPVASSSGPTGRSVTGRFLHRVFLGLVAGAILAPPIATAADSLAVLGFVDAKGKARTVEVADKTGPAESKETRTPVDRWVLSAGESLNSASAPMPRELVLFTAGDGEPRPLCTVEVRYYPAGSNHFRPLYRLQDRITIARVGASWKPVPLGTGDPLLTELPDSGLPNPDGYAEKLVFGIPQATVAITGWEVR
jgi:hypothetical protein